MNLKIEILRHHIYHLSCIITDYLAFRQNTQGRCLVNIQEIGFKLIKTINRIISKILYLWTFLRQNHTQTHSNSITNFILIIYVIENNFRPVALTILHRIKIKKLMYKKTYKLKNHKCF